MNSIAHPQFLVRQDFTPIGIQNGILAGAKKRYGYGKSGNYPSGLRRLQKAKKPYQR